MKTSELLLLCYLWKDGSISPISSQYSIEKALRDSSVGQLDKRRMFVCNVSYFKILTNKDETIEGACNNRMQIDLIQQEEINRLKVELAAVRDELDEANVWIGEHD